MNKKNNSSNFIENIALTIGITVLIFLLFISVIFSTYIMLDLHEVPIISKKVIPAIFSIIFGIIVFYYFVKYLNKISDRTLFAICTVIYTLFAIYLIFNVEAQIRGDAQGVYKGAICLMQNDYSVLNEGGYFFYYPHQLGLALYTSVINLFSTNLRVHFIVNYFMLMLAYFVTWKCAKLMFEKEKIVVNLTIIIMFLFYPPLFFTLFIYGHIPGCLCIMLAIYLFIKREKNIGKHNEFAIVLLIICACTIRNNYMIAAIAIAILYIFDAIRKKNWRPLVITVLILVTFSLGSNLVKQYYQKQSGIEINEGIPKILWVAMGIQDVETGYCMGGWWNMYNTEAYEAANYDEEIASDNAKIAIQERIDEFKDDIGYTIKYFGKKVISTWTDPTYESIWSGPLETCGQEIYSKYLKSIYNGGTAFKLLSIFGRMVNISIYIGAIAFFVFKKIINREKLLIVQYFPVIYLCGGFMFHLIWETKSQYVWSYVFMLIPLAACGWYMIIERLKNDARGNYIMQKERK